jgi:hypothetical protein
MMTCFSSAMGVLLSRRWRPSACHTAIGDRGQPFFRETGIENHAAVNIKCCAVNAVGMVGSEPDGSPGNVFGFSDALVRDHLHEFVVRGWRVPGGLVFSTQWQIVPFFLTELPLATMPMILSTGLLTSRLGLVETGSCLQHQETRW